MTRLGPPGYRTSQRARRRRRHLGALVAAALVLIVVAAAAAFALTRSSSATPGKRAGPASTPQPSTLLALAVRGAPSLVALIGSEGVPAPTVVSLPSDMTFTIPGQGEGSIADAASLQGSWFRVAVSNLVGSWVNHYAVMERSSLSALVDRMGGVTLDLSGPIKLGKSTVGPGTTTLTGAQVLRYLSIDGPNLEVRWELVLEGLVRTRPLVLPSDLAETDDAAAATATLSAARGASVQELPVKNLGTTARRPLVGPDEDRLPSFVSSAFGRDDEAVPVVVVNGSGAPGVGESVAAKVVPAGFRVVLSQNADRFDKKTTAIIASGDEHVSEAQRLRDALGIGQVQVTRVPSGLADVTIVVGKDYGRG
jgi:hypothetical protein